MGLSCPRVSRSLHWNARWGSNAFPYWSFWVTFHHPVLLFSHPVVSNSLLPHGLQHARPPCLSLSPGVCPHLWPLHQWCHPAISSSTRKRPRESFFNASWGAIPLPWLESNDALPLLHSWSPDFPGATREAPWSFSEYHWASTVLSTEHWGYKGKLGVAGHVLPWSELLWLYEKPETYLIHVFITSNHPPRIFHIYSKTSL